MVQKIWNLETARSWLPAKPPRPPARIFSEPRFQNKLPVWYLVYRCVILTAWMLIVVFSLLGVGTQASRSLGSKWLIYLTHWDIILGLSQALLGLMVVWKRWKLERSNVDVETMKTEKLEMIYWYLYAATCTLAIGVTVTYWSVVHQPSMPVDPLNIMVHVCNSVLMILDIIVSCVPLSFLHFWWPLTIALAYAVFSLIYYVAGGLDARGMHYIYGILDWEKPGQTLLICFVITISLIVVHCLLCFVTMFGERKFASMREKYILETSSTSVTAQQTRKTVYTVDVV